MVDAATGRVQQMAAGAARDPNAPIANGWLIFYLALVVAVLLIVASVIYAWHHGSGQGNVLVDVVWRITWVTFSVLKVTLIVLLVIWGARWFGRRRERAGTGPMPSNDLEVCDGAVAGPWIKPRLGGEFGAVTLQVPKGYEAYGRVFHPASDPDGNPVKWADVAEAIGTVAHREMQWHAILGLSGPDELQGFYEPDAATGPNWAGKDPPIGEMDIETLDALCEILIAQTTDPNHCYFGLCTIQSWADEFSANELKPLLKLPMERDHIVLTGPLSAVDQIVRTYPRRSPGAITFVARSGEGPLPKPEEHQWERREAPNLIWPADRSWFVVSEVDFDSTLVGGSADLIKAIVESPELEAWQVEPTDSLAFDADKVNRRSAPL
jgi:uncharacterized membrane protein